MFFLNQQHFSFGQIPSLHLFCSFLTLLMEPREEQGIPLHPYVCEKRA